MEGCIPRPSHCKNVLDKYNFSMVSNLVDYNKLYALSTHNRKCANNCIIFGELKHSEIGQKLFNKICFVQKALKWPLQCADFQIFFGGACSLTPLHSFLFLNALQINFA